MTEPRWDAAGLAPAIVQDVADGRVLMLAWMNREALEATRSTGEVHFWSRSRGTLWRKGETSGNILRLVRLDLDCDRDAILVTAQPAGPTCHRLTRSCFDPDPRPDPGVPGSAPVELGRAAPASRSPQGFAWLESLWETIDERAALRPAGSYTVRLLDGGVDLAGRKVTEEATEVLLAAKDDAVAEARSDAGAGRARTHEALVGEAADLAYHLLVLLRERGVAPAEVVTRLRDRHAR